jgi:ubiquinone/menaquinone biosynthesis C-methylase UbiE
MPHDAPDAEPERWGRLFAWMYSLTGRNSYSNRVVVEHASLEPGDRVLDLGCGPGAALAAATKMVDPSRLAGVDPTPGFIDQCRRRFPTADIRLGSAEDIPFEDDRFTVAWTIASFHHWVDPDAGLVELLRVLAGGGRVIVVEDLLRRSGGHGVAQDEIDDLAARIEDAGFTAVTVETVRKRWGRMIVVTGRKPGAPGTSP